jgi:hypothetical protein
MKYKNEIPYIDDMKILSAELRRLSSLRKKIADKLESKKFSKEEKKEIYLKTNGFCHVCGIEISSASFSITTSINNSNNFIFFPACKSCKRIHDNYLPEEIQWILKIGLWAKTQIEYETDIGKNISTELVEQAKYRESKRKSPRNPLQINISEFPIKENFIIKKKKTEFSSIQEVLYWSYANLGMATKAVSDNAENYGTLHFIIRKKLFNGFMNSTMSVGSLFGEEKSKLHSDKCCVYCGSTKSLQVDHIIPRKKGGKDSGENIVLACRKCNASKNDTDLLEWYSKKNSFPPLDVLRNYMKLVIQFCIENKLMENKAELACEFNLPFSFTHIPLDFPQPKELIKNHNIGNQ